MLLDARDISVRFGGIPAVDNVDIACDVGEIVGVVGPNGSGKTTLLNALTGVVEARGSLTVAGEPVQLCRPEHSYRAGLQRVFQAPQMFPACSVLENVALSVRDKTRSGFASACLGRRAMWRHERDRWHRAREALARVGLEEVADAPASSLPYGRQRLVELARAIAANPRVLMLDEPSAGLNESETDDLGKLIPSFLAPDMAAIIIDHKIDFIDRLCGRVMVLELGRVVADGKPAEVWSDPRVIDAYLGRTERA